MKKSRHMNRAPLAYKNEAFLDSWNGRAIRILAEYLEPLDRFSREKIRDTVVFFGSARITEDGPLGRYYHEAREFARLITQWSNALEPPNRRARDAGGKSIGLNIALPHEQYPNPYITPELNFEFNYFFMRKFWFAYLAKALIVFPGGFGTLDELTELLTLAQTQKLEKKIMIMLYGREYWREIINFDALARHGMISPEDLELMEFVDDVHTAMDHLKKFLTENYLQPQQIRAAEEMPDIAKSRL